jgi:hypothetical protein
MKKLITSSVVFLFAFTAFSQKITFQLKEKRIHYTDLAGKDVDFVNITEAISSTLIFNLKDSLVSLKNNNGTTISKIIKISKKNHQYLFETVDKYSVDPSQSGICYYMIDCKKQVGYQKYIGFCIKDMYRVTDFKGNVTIN